MNDGCTNLNCKAKKRSDQSCSVLTTVYLQSLQTDDSLSTGAGKIPTIVKSVFVNPDILAMVSGAIMRMKEL